MSAPTEKSLSWNFGNKKEIHKKAEENHFISSDKKTQHKIYAWFPPGIRSHKVDEYFAQLPNNKVPRWKSLGKVYRDQQLVYQLPKQDFSLSCCQNLDGIDQKSFEEFVKMRNELALEVAYVKELVEKQNECAKCRGTMMKGEVAILSAKFGDSVTWHPACFTCSTCEELLVDLTHCVQDQKLFCERHFAEQIKPRCSFCDELIFNGEFTKAMSKDWHSSHFCCWQCNETLTGQKYVVRDDHPFCTVCYEQLYSNTCHECTEIIGINSKDISYKEKHWHECCFVCNNCKSSLINKPFGFKVEKIYCASCYDATFVRRCDGCNQTFRAGMRKVEYKNLQWHEKCFTCNFCKNILRSFIPRGNDVYCTACYKQKYATRCTKCCQIICGGGITYRKKPWHRQCFLCSNCGTSLAGQRFTSKEEKPYCAQCFGQLFAKKCILCLKAITGVGDTRFISFEDRNWHNNCFKCAECDSSLVGKGFITDGPDILCPECAKQRLM